jgi:hypothetical protein
MQTMKVPDTGALPYDIMFFVLFFRKLGFFRLVCNKVTTILLEILHAHLDLKTRI